MIVPSIREQIENTTFVDTHEHLLEERTRLAGPGTHRLQPCDDAALLFAHYASDDLWSAGMTDDEARRFFAPDGEPVEKWNVLKPYWNRSRHTGYLRAVAESAKRLFGVERLDAATFTLIGDEMRRRAQPGFYHQVIQDAAKVEVCQINSLESAVPGTQYPDLLKQDLSIVGFSTDVGPPNLEFWATQSALPTASLEDWHQVIDWAFATYGPTVDAVKSQAAYGRRLDYAPVSAEDASPLFARMAARDVLSAAERKALEDHLMLYCIEQAARAGLPIKLHCGYYAGHDRMPLDRVRRNAGDLWSLLTDYPDAKFVLMHIGYPYQDEYIALAKHYRNVTIDLCWAWIINPRACVRFVKEFLMAAPSNKLLTFGGDYATVENIVGHAAIARQGMAQALSELVEEG
ncbi:MAG TPA: amidohydrolase family protein, partial [Chloroflexota bacterium]|nr:amidohydrolase family protein [Chloroflexota bacterium]